jgi:subtilisin family serine protease
MYFSFLRTDQRRLIALLLIVTLVAAFCWKKRVISLPPIPQKASGNASLLYQHFLVKRVEHRDSPPSSSLTCGAPLDALSQEEQCYFPGACLIEATEIDAPHPGEKIRLRVLETHCKYPYIRTEERIDSASGALLHRTEMVATHLFVRLSSEDDPAALLHRLGPDAITLERISRGERLYRLQLQSPSLATWSHVFKGLKELPLLGEEPDFLVHAAMRPNNPLYSKQWYLWKSCSNITGPWDKRLFNSCIDAFDAWDIENSAPSVVVGVIDTGIRYTHEDLKDNMWHDPMDRTICGWNFSVKENDPESNNPMDGYGHGTACAGIIGAVGNSGVGVVGIAWRVQLMALKFLNDEGVGFISDAVRSIDVASEHGAQILNCSWGYVTSEVDQQFNNSFSDHIIISSQSTALEAALRRARDRGIIVVTAAGNEGKDNDQYPEYPANYALDNILSVAATTEDNKLLSFSSYGATTVDIAAPGEEIFSTWARSDHDYITDTTRQEIFQVSSASEVAKDPQGTSFAVPQVVGALALLKEHFPTYSYQELIRRVIDTSDRLPALEGKMVGGKLNIARALGDPW